MRTRPPASPNIAFAIGVLGLSQTTPALRPRCGSAISRARGCCGRSQTQLFRSQTVVRDGSFDAFNYPGYFLTSKLFCLPFKRLDLLLYLQVSLSHLTSFAC